MPKAATATTTKAATKTANAKTAKLPKEEKVKRAPTAYNVFMKDTLATYKAEHPEMNHQEAFKAVAALWKDAPENPNRGQEPRSKKKSTEDKENATSKPKAKSKSKSKSKSSKKEVVQSEEEDAERQDSDE